MLAKFDIGRAFLYKKRHALVSAQMAELVDALASGASGATHGSSSLLLGTKHMFYDQAGFADADNSPQK